MKFIDARYYSSEKEFDKARTLFDELTSITGNSFVWREVARNEALAESFNDSITILESHPSRADDPDSTVLLDQIRAVKASIKP